MKTIKERADEFIGHPHECDEGTPITMARFAYIRGAKEQEEIDDKRIAELESFAERATKLIEAEKAFREHLEDENEKLIDKACLVYEKELRQMKRILNEVKDGAGELICISGSLSQFREAMEE